MSCRIKAVTGVLSLFCLIPSAGAQAQPTCTQSVPVSVLQLGTGTVLTELHPSAFRITLGGTPVTVLSAQRDLQPRSVVFLLNVNDDIARSPYNWEMESGALRVLLKGIHKEYNVGMVAFSNKGMRTIGFDAGRKGILDWLATVDADRGQLDSAPYPVGLQDAIHAAVEMLPYGEFGSAIVSVGPGEAQRSHVSWEVVNRELTQRVIRVFSVHPFVMMAGGGGPEDPGTIGEVTGGVSFAFPNLFIVVHVRVKILDEYDYDYYVDRIILAPQRLELRLDTLPPPGAKWKVEIVNPKNRKKRRDVYVVFPYNIPYCRQPSGEAVERK